MMAKKLNEREWKGLAKTLVDPVGVSLPFLAFQLWGFTWYNGGEGILPSEAPLLAMSLLRM